MEKLFSTATVHPRDRFDYWHEVACRHIVDHDSQPQCRSGFEAEIEAGALADIGLVLFANSPMTVAHTARHVARLRSDDLFLCRQLAGGVALEQEAREVFLEAGDLALLDPTLPYTARFSPGSNLLVAKLPRRALEARIGRVRPVVARAMKPLTVETSLASSLLAVLPTYLGRMDRALEEMLRDQMLDLAAASLAATMQAQGPGRSSARALVLLNVRAAIESRLSDPALDAKAVAAAAGVSVRYANAVLADQDTSIARLIQERRLARCRRALEDRHQAHRSVSEIAYGWGFSDMTHFGRSFRKAYEMLPSAYRRRVRSPESR